MRDFLQPQEGSFLLVLIVFLVLCHFRVSGVPFLGTPCRSGSLRESCIANMRVILGAIEIYNMDHPTKLSRIDADVLEDLLRKGPARFFLVCPGDTKNRSDNAYIQSCLQNLAWNLDSSWISQSHIPGTAYAFSVSDRGNDISCKMHGSIGD